MYNGLISYYDTLLTFRVRRLSMRVVPDNFRKIVMSACHVSPFALHIHEERTLFGILARFCWSMVNKQVSQLIRTCAHRQQVNSRSHETQQLLQTIESDTLFDVVFLDFWEPGDIPDRDGSRKILTCLDCVTVFRIGASTGLKEITSCQAARWGFGNFFVPFGLPKMIIVDLDGLFFWNVQEDFPTDLTNTSTYNCKGQPQGNQK